MDLLTGYKDNCGFGALANIKNIPSHKIVEDAITALERMMHRGAIAADGKSGDGSGLLFSLPNEFLRNEAKLHGVDLPEQFAVAQVFFTDAAQIDIFKSICEQNDLSVAFVRQVPVDTVALGAQALAKLPDIKQIFVVPNSLMATKRFDALLYLTRKEIEKALGADGDFYICSFSSQVIVYKGLVMPTHIKEFYKDLNSKKFKCAFALFHQRFSTNTLPKWRLAQPFRSLAHNGEINSVEANRYNAIAKCESLKSDVFTPAEIARILPLLQDGSSDSASLDNFLEFLLINGFDFFKATRALIPAPWQNAPHLDAKLRAFYEYTSACFEAWDGPAAVTVTNGRYIGCILDRNGLRPSKYIITKDDRILIASEYGVIDIDEKDILERGRLQSGQMIGVDLKFGKVLKNNDINEYLKTSKPYNEWLNKHMIHIQEFVDAAKESVDYGCDDLVHKQLLFNYTYELIDMVIKPSFEDGKENTGSMGDDTPVAAFSKEFRPLCDFFKQKFAQVTNPPIDPLREKVVMSLNTGFGEIHNILTETGENAKRIKTYSPILTKDKLEVLLSFGDTKSARYEECYKTGSFSTTFEKDLESSLEALCEQVVSAVKNDGVRIIVLDDRVISEKQKALPMAMVVGRLNSVLLSKGVRHLVSTLCITAETYDSHSCAVLIGYGAQAIYPYLLYATVYDIVSEKEGDEHDIRAAIKNVQHSIDLGLQKILSKMGIATIASYRNSGLFDAIGISQKVVDKCFHGSYALLGGLDFSDIEEKLEEQRQKAFQSEGVNKIFPLEIGGFYKYSYEKEYHDYSPAVVYAMQKMALTNDKKDYEAFKGLINNRGNKMIRDFLTLKSDKKPISIEEVESKEKIFKRFATAAMSLGSISPEAHEALAKAMNSIGGMSNSGEGGESPERTKSDCNSKIKQVASGRFGVTPGYLRSASEIQIKLAQGAKPGEGGQLPGDKVTPLIAKLRFTVPGVTLISPPPHHDIYSIEDLAQLIFDLKQVNPAARISVKLVSTAGVGTIAAGVAKAYADKIIISGSEGGTGAAPLTSIKFAGNPWELGLAEAHNALKVNGLREFVRLETDGGLKTGLDVVKAAMLGAESYAFGTGALVLLGCKILRVCHLNKCTEGIATQEPELRDNFHGTAEKIVNYMNFLAEDVREILASLGYKSLEEIIGRNELLAKVDGEFASKFDFSSLLYRASGSNTCAKESNPPFDSNEFEKEVVEEVSSTIKNPINKIVVERDITNLNRSFGAMLSGEIAKYYGDNGLADDAITIRLNGIAGQSLGVFLNNGISIYLNGYANDYVCKGMHGGKVVITPKLKGEAFAAAGNTCLYGATGGELYIDGSVGERFAVRNSGALAVVEGSGDHACEYMTRGTVVILGKTGINFGAGMTGGIAFVYDKDKEFIDKLNGELVLAKRIDTDESDEVRQHLKKILKKHYNETKSDKALTILSNFREEIRYFWLVMPKAMKAPLNPREGN
jgi:glutamate synthase (NADPH) large chain